MMISAATGDLIIIYAAPVKLRGEIVGVFYGRKNAAALSAVIDHFSYGETGYQYIMNEHDNVVAHKDTAMVLEQFNMLENAAGTEEAVASVEEQTASMEQIASTSEALAKLAEEMNIGVTKFKY